jgi:hypothetical protein
MRYLLPQPHNLLPKSGAVTFLIYEGKSAAEGIPVRERPLSDGALTEDRFDPVVKVM